jgi:O-antigen ligase
MQVSWFPRALEAIVFYSLLAVIALTAIPYGTVQPWWESVFQCLVFALAFLYVVAQLLKSETPRFHSAFPRRLLWPVLALIAFAFLQTLSTPPVPRFLLAATDQRATISADVFQTRQFVVQLLTLLLVGWLLTALVNSRRRLLQLVELVIGIGVVSALFGLWRQASQQGPGFGLRGLRPGFGYAQFINANHFAFLMELALGLALGIVVCRGVKGWRLAIYLLAAIPMWIALVLANSRGGILSLLCQVLFLALLFSVGRDWRDSREAEDKTDIRTDRQGEHRTERQIKNERQTIKRADKLGGRLLRASRTVAARAVLVAALLAGAVTTVVLVGGDPLAGRVDSLAVELDRNVADSYTLRPAIWRATWSLIMDHPLAGVGFGGYWVAITKYHVASGETTPQEAHNDYLELLASGGVIGLAIGIWFVVALLKTVREKLAQLGGEAQGAKGEGPRGTGQGERVKGEEERAKGQGERAKGKGKNGGDDSSGWSNSFARAATIGALVGILTVAVHSLVDFGLHITINAVVFTVLVAIIAMRPEIRGQRSEIRDQRSEIRDQKRGGLG